MFTFVIRGTRGTSTMCGKDYLRHGGHTTCFSVHSSEGIIVIDAGSGIVNLCRDIHQYKGKHNITMLFTHFHLDHVVGLPSFLPLYEKESRISIMADPRRSENWKQTLTTFMSKPYWPVKLGETESSLEFSDLPVDTGSMTVYGLKVSWFRVPHPQQSLSFKIEDGTKSIVVATDVEYECGKADPAFINFCKGCDDLIFDSQYTEDEYKHFKGWGHSTWNTGVSIAQAASVKELVLFHHLPDRTDDEIDNILKDAQKLFPGTKAACPNMIL